MRNGGTNERLEHPGEGGGREGLPNWNPWTGGYGKNVVTNLRRNPPGSVKVPDDDDDDGW